MTLPCQRLLYTIAASISLHVGILLALQPFVGPWSPRVATGGAPIRVALLEPAEQAGASAAALFAPDEGEPQPKAPKEAAEATFIKRVETPVPAPYYYSLAELDVRPWIKVRVEPQFPIAAMGSQHHGAVVLRLYINESGLIDRTFTVSAPDESAFLEAAVQAFSAAQFLPAMKNGQPVKSQLLVEVDFDARLPEPG